MKYKVQLSYQFMFPVLLIEPIIEGNFCVIGKIEKTDDEGNVIRAENGDIEYIYQFLKNEEVLPSQYRLALFSDKFISPYANYIISTSGVDIKDRCMLADDVFVTPIRHSDASFGAYTIDTSYDIIEQLDKLKQILQDVGVRKHLWYDVLYTMINKTKNFNFNDPNDPILAYHFYSGHLHDQANENVYKTFVDVQEFEDFLTSNQSKIERQTKAEEFQKTQQEKYDQQVLSNASVEVQVEVKQEYLDELKQNIEDLEKTIEDKEKQLSEIS